MVQVLRQKLVQDLFACFSQFHSILSILKSQIVCRGAKLFLAGCWGVTFFPKKMFFVVVFLIREKEKEQRKNKTKQKDIKKKQKIVFWGGWEQKLFLLKWHLKNTFFPKAKKGIFIDTICFGRISLFLWPYKITKHYKNRGFSRHRGKTKMALLVWKRVLSEGASKRAFPICDAQKLCSAKNTIL